jgi:hypothetical protein
LGIASPAGCAATRLVVAGGRPRIIAAASSDTAATGHSTIESQAKSTGTTLTTAPDGTRAHSQFRNDA